MADYALIEEYLDVVSRRLAHRRDAIDLRDELADHLLESVDVALAGGVDREFAQRIALDRFGDPHIVAGMLAAVPTKGIDMIATLSRAAGAFLISAAVAWILVIVLGPTGLVGYLDQTWSVAEYTLQALAQGIAVALTGLALVAVNVRVANRVDALTGVVIVAMVLTLLIAFVFAWSYLAWGGYLAAALAITAARVARTEAGAGIVSVLMLWVVPTSLVVGSLLSIQFLAFQGSVPLTSADERTAELVMLVAGGVVYALIAAGMGVLGFRLNAQKVPSDNTPGFAVA
ncbi:MAG: permease prefix domain 1-containing protein [Microbacteriaceae bacterium]